MKSKQERKAITVSNCKDTLFYLDMLRKATCTQIRFADYSKQRIGEQPPEHLSTYDNTPCVQTLDQMKKTLNQCYPKQYEEVLDNINTDREYFGLEPISRF